MNLQSFLNNPNFDQIKTIGQREEFCRAVNDAQSPTHWSEVITKLCDAIPNDIPNKKTDNAIADIMRRLSQTPNHSVLYKSVDYVLTNISDKLFGNHKHLDEKSLKREDSLKAALHVAASKDLHSTVIMLVKRMEPEIAYMELLTMQGNGVLPSDLAHLVTELESQLGPKKVEIIKIAENINRNKLELRQVTTDRQTIIKLAPFLTHIDCNQMDFFEWSHDEADGWIAKCTNAEFLSIHTSSLTRFGHLFKCVHLDCSDCVLLRTLPDKMPACKSLNCSSCSIQVLQTELDKCEEVTCNFCGSLKSVTAVLPSCLFFDCSYCSELVSIKSNLPACQTLQARGNDLLTDYPPELEHFFYNPLIFQVKTQDLKDNPKDLLAHFSEKVRENDKIPQVVFLDENGKKSAGFDAGGLRRQLLTDLFANLFESSKLERCLDFLKSTEGMIPLVKNDEDKGHYEDIGHLFRVAFYNDINIGKIFPPKVFEAISLLLQEEDPSYQLYCLMNGLDVVSQVLTMGKNEGFSPTQLDQIRYFLFSDLGIYTDDAPTIRHLQEQLSTDLGAEEIQKLIQSKIVELSKDPEYQEMIIPIVQIAKGIKSVPHKELTLASPEDLNERIQGALTKELLVASLTFQDFIETENEVETETENTDIRLNPQYMEQAVKTQKFLLTWIEDSKKFDDQRLKRFTKVVSGSATLSPTTKIKIKLTNPDNPQTLPSCSTCAIKINIPITYDDQTQFNEKMELFLTEAIAGSGFQYV